ncbi:cysteine desulfurase [Candidatus Gottesmanbacteria bacterium]|nr:cysteine desulfurase [Candidatus Gottesmanbacteria bacterium]
MFDTHLIRKDFPILTRTIHGKPIVYLDSTASSLKPKLVLDAIMEYYTKFSVNIFRGIYTLSEEATQKYEDARVKVAKFIGAKSENEIVFVRNATEAINLVAATWGRAHLDRESEIVSTVMEHHANIVPWQEISQKSGAKLSYAGITPDYELDIDHLEKLITSRTKLVVLTYVSNVLGTINPMKEVIRRIKSKNPKTIILIDGAQAVPHMSVDVSTFGCDFFVFSGHKMLAPTGVGVLWGKYDLLQEMPPYQTGGEMIKEVYLEKTIFKDAPHKFEAGTPHIAGTIGLGAAIDYLSTLGMDAVRKHEEEVTRYALKVLGQLKGVKIFGPERAERKGGVVAFTVLGVHPHDLAQVLDSDNICIRSGNHCAMPLHTYLKLSATARSSFYIYNTKEEVDLLAGGIEKATRLFNG